MERTHEEAKQRLAEIMCELEDLGAEARTLVGKFFPGELGMADAYEVFMLGRSSNKYDTTLESIIRHINR